jgi:hypothetical protein
MFTHPYYDAVGALLLWSVVLIAISVAQGRYSQVPSLTIAVVTVPLFMTYYWDRFGGNTRELAKPLTVIPGSDIHFGSSIVLSLLILVGYAIRMINFLLVRRRPHHRDDRIYRFDDEAVLLLAAYTLYCTVAALVISTYSLGWIGVFAAALLGTAAWTGLTDSVPAAAKVVLHLLGDAVLWVWNLLVAMAQTIWAVLGFILDLRGIFRAESLNQLHIRLREASDQRASNRQIKRNEREQRAIAARNRFATNGKGR